MDIIPDDGTLARQMTAISLMVKALAIEHPQRDAVLRTYDQLCAHLMATPTYLDSNDEARQLLRMVLDELRDSLE
ncbi:MAG: hypothetical protein HY847_05920 [Betaproteobacteria bacterium]|nr:hypothetical protein [Betaproteobacteria bacterium]